LSPSHSQVPLIGGVIGGIVALVLLAAAFLLWRRQRQRHAQSLPSPVIEDEEKIGDEEKSPELESSSP
jgi:Flp pilus assembly protein TadB